MLQDQNNEDFFWPKKKLAKICWNYHKFLKYHLTSTTINNDLISSVCVCIYMYIFFFAFLSF